MLGWNLGRSEKRNIIMEKFTSGATSVFDTLDKVGRVGSPVQNVCHSMGIDGQPASPNTLSMNKETDFCSTILIRHVVFTIPEEVQSLA